MFKDAEKSLRFYRNIKTTDDAINNQLINDELEKFKTIAQQNESQPPLTVADFSNTNYLLLDCIDCFLKNSLIYVFS